MTIFVVESIMRDQRKEMTDDIYCWS
jgi:hypothetical protein